MSLLSKNIKFLRSKLGISQDDFATQIGVKRGVAGSIETGRTEPSVDLLLKLSEVFLVDVDSLIKLDIESLKNERDGIETSANDEVHHSNVIEYGKKEIVEVTQGKLITMSESKSGHKQTPFFNIVVSAGEHGITDWGMEEPTGFFIDIPSFRAADAAFPVLGFSMEPEISNGDIVGVKEMQKWDIVDTAGVYMLITDQERMIKRLKPDDDDDNMFWCLSNNYAPFKLLRTDIRKMFKVVACISIL